MCSIYGSIGQNYKNIGAFFSKELHHRGPDDKGVFYDEDLNLSIGHTRLSIIDLSNHAHQPMCDKNNDFVLSYNGEIYNYIFLKNKLEKLGYHFNTNSDTEVVLNSYIQWRENCVKYFRGMFAFCLYDKKKKELFLARDRFGIKPLIYTFLNNQFVFCSELKPFLNSNFIPKKLDQISTSNYFKYGAVKQPRTILQDVYQLMPGCTMKVQCDLSFRINQYYNLPDESQKINKIETYDEAVKQVRIELEAATHLHMVSDVEVGAFLSGGVDSTAIVAMMKQFSDKQLNTFSIGFSGKTDVLDESEVAKRTAEKLGANHHSIKINDNYVAKIFDDFILSIDQPTIDGINTFIVSYETAKDLKVALSGLGGDEIFAGYSHFDTIKTYSNRKENLFSLFGKQLNALRPNRYTQKFEYIGLDATESVNNLRTINRKLDKILLHYSEFNGIKKLVKLSSIQQISKAEIDNYMLNTLLRDNDVTSMSHSLEVRPILLDHKLVELAFSLDDDFKVKNGQLKSVFIDSVKDIIPEEVWQRKKSGFEMPFSIWMNGCLNNIFMRVIDNSTAKMIFTKDHLNELKKRTIERKLLRHDWIDFIFLNWLEKYEIEV